MPSFEIRRHHHGHSREVGSPLTLRLTTINPAALRTPKTSWPKQCSNANANHWGFWILAVAGISKRTWCKLASTLIPIEATG